MSLHSPHSNRKLPHAAPMAGAGVVRNQRRSKRMGLNASVGLSGEDRLRCSFTMPARATNLNKHGAAVQVTRDLEVGSVVRLRFWPWPQSLASYRFFHHAQPASVPSV